MYDVFIGKLSKVASEKYVSCNINESASVHQINQNYETDKKGRKLHGL